MSCISHHLRAALVAALGLLALTCTVPDILVTWEPDAFRTGQSLEKGRVDAAFAVTPAFSDLDAFGQSLVPNRAGLGLGLGNGFEARAGWSWIGTHNNRTDSMYWNLNAAELRLRRQFIAQDGFRLGGGAGLDVVWGDADGRRRYYGLRPMLQFAGGWFTSFGVGAYVPISATYTALKTESGTGFAVTPGFGVAYETEHFFVRAAYNYPAGDYTQHSDSVIRIMAPYYGLQLGGRVRLFE